MSSFRAALAAQGIYIDIRVVERHVVIVTPR